MGYHNSRLSVKAKEKVIDTQQDTVILSADQIRQNQLNVAILLIRNGEDWNRPDMKRRGLAIIAELAFPPVKLGILDATLISNRRDWFIKAVEEKNHVHGTP
jgi:hypothetical protein